VYRAFHSEQRWIRRSHTGAGVALRLGARQPKASPWSPPAYQPAKPVLGPSQPRRACRQPARGPAQARIGAGAVRLFAPGVRWQRPVRGAWAGPVIVAPPVTQKQALQSVMLAKSLIYGVAGPNLRPRFWSSATGARSRPVQSRIGLIYLVVLRLLSQLLPPGLAGLGSKMVASGS
jgi:hypothetical protein